MKSLLKKTQGSSMEFSEALLAYHDTPAHPNVPTPSQFMSSYHSKNELLMINWSWTDVLDNRAQYKQRYLKNIQSQSIC